MEHRITPEQLKNIIAFHLNITSKSGTPYLKLDEIDISFIKDSNSTRVDGIVISKKIV